MADVAFFLAYALTRLFFSAAAAASLITEHGEMASFVVHVIGVHDALVLRCSGPAIYGSGLDFVYSREKLSAGREIGNPSVIGCLNAVIKKSA